MIQKNDEIKLLIHIHGGKHYDITKAVSSIIWSGDIKSPSRTLEFNFIQAVNDKKVQKLGIVVNTTACFYVNNKEIFRGQIVDIDTSSSNNSVKITAKDIGFLLNKDQVNFNFKDTTACDIAKAVFKGKDGAPSLSWGKIAPAGTKMTKMFVGATRYDAIMTAYTEHSKSDKDHKKYMIEVDIDKFNVIEKGITTLKIEFDETKNLEHSSYKESIDKLINRVLVVDESGNKVKVATNDKLKNLYKYYITKVVDQKKGETISDEQIKSNFEGLDRSCNLSGFGDITCKSGYKVQVKDSFTGLVGEFYIDKDKHTWVGGKYNIDLDLNFENIMDEKNADKKENKEKTEGGLTGGDITSPWNGITLSMIEQELANTTLKGYAKFVLKCAHAYNFNPIIMINIWKVESYNEIRSGLALKHNNFGGINWSNKSKYGKVYIKDRYYVKYPSIEAGIEDNFRLVSVTYVHKWGKHSLTSIMGTYSPSFENDTSTYIKTLKSRYQKITGKAWDDKYLGSGVESEAAAKRKMTEMEQTVSNNTGSANYSSSIQRRICQIADQIGPQTKYCWGGRGVGNRYKTDCSGFVSRVLWEAGVKEKNAIRGATTSALAAHGKTISPSQAQAGDIVVCDSPASGSGKHTFLLMGNNKCWDNGGPEGARARFHKPYWGANAVIKRYW